MCSTLGLVVTVPSVTALLDDAITNLQWIASMDVLVVVRVEGDTRQRALKVVARASH